MEKRALQKIPVSPVTVTTDGGRVAGRLVLQTGGQRTAQKTPFQREPLSETQGASPNHNTPRRLLLRWAERWPPKHAHVLIPRPVTVTLQSRRDSADVTDVMDLEMGRLSWIIWEGPK